jgi:hypothetical protein
MKRLIFKLSILVIILISFQGCTKWSDEKINLAQAIVLVAQPISDAAPLSGAIKGTMLAGKKYTISDNVIINRGDTVTIQEGVHINVKNQAAIVIRGTLISLGTKTAQNWITVDSLQALKNDGVNVDPSKDPAFAGGWRGLLCDTSCPMLVLKWTHIEFAGAAWGNVAGPMVEQKATTAFSIIFQNPNGYFIMEDSWLYGGVDDGIRISNGKIAFLRSTFEKEGYNGGDCLNCKGGTVGDMAYNVFIGTATNGQKASNKGIPTGAMQTNVRMWNNTFIAGGYRQTQTGRGANINFEEGSKGMAYNNLMVNCKFGLRIVNNPVADTANIKYGNNLEYADSLSVANQIYPVTYITIPQPTDIPNPSSFLQAGYQPGSAYDGSSVVQKNNPLFYNFTLPVPGGVPLAATSAIGSFNFRIAANSPAAGKGFTGFAPLAAVPIDPKYGATEITLPGTDIGAYQTNGTGNQH